MSYVQKIILWDSMNDWTFGNKICLILNGFMPKDIFNMDKIGLFFNDFQIKHLPLKIIHGGN